MKRSALWLRVATGVGLLVWIVARSDFQSLTVVVGPRLVVGLSVAVGLVAAAQAFAALRWKVILGPEAPSWLYLYRLYLIGLFFSLFLPTSIGGDTVRAAAASARKLGEAGFAVASVILDRVVGVFALLCYFVLGVALDRPTFQGLAAAVVWKTPTHRLLVLLGVTAVVGGALVVLLTRRWKALRAVMDQGRRLTWAFATSPLVLVRAIVLGFLVQALYILAWAALAMGLGWSLRPAFLLLAVPFVSLAAMAPVTISGLGVREGAWVLLLRPLGIASLDAVAYGLLYFLSVMVVAGVGGVLFALRGIQTSDPVSPGPQHSPRVAT